MIRLNNLGSYDDDYKMVGNYAASIDPRLKKIDGVYQVLDSIPRNGKINDPLNFAYNTNYSSHYQNYSDIHLGDVTYYLDPYLGQPFLPINFTNTNFIKKKYVDPMGVEKSNYKQCENLSPQQSCLTWINDSNKNREEFMALNMAKINQNNFNVEMWTQTDFL
ncbi:MAG: hypothetical protein ACRC39_00795 [Enterobacter sp.]